MAGSQGIEGRPVRSYGICDRSRVGDHSSGVSPLCAGKRGPPCIIPNCGHGGKEVIRFTPANAHWVRYYGKARGTPFGHSLWELRVFP